MSLTAIPNSLNAGDQWEWTVTNGDYPASDGWVMTYTLINSDGRISITSTASDDSHVVDFDASDVSAGSYEYQQYFTLSGERKTADRGFVEVKPDFASAANYDGRSHVKKVLDAIRANLEGVASKSQQSYSIEGRSLSRYSLEELSNLEQRYERRWQSELNDLAVAQGRPPGGRVQLKLGAG